MPDAATPRDPIKPPPPPVLNYGTAASQYAETVVRIATYSDTFEAELVRAKLESEGIRCIVEGSALMGAGAETVPAMRKFHVDVLQSDAERSLMILARIAERRSQRQREERIDETCPKCGATMVARSPTRGYITFGVWCLAFLLFACMFVPFRGTGVVWLCLGCFTLAAYLLGTLDRASWRCKSCGHRWKPA